MSAAVGDSALAAPVPLMSYFSRRWRGQVRLGPLFWRDTIVVGSLINLLSSFLALALMAAGAPLITVAAAHFAPLPYNVFLFAALWRMPDRPAWMSACIIAWLLLAILV